ncbi:MAG: vWA domain-containing protein, partial [Candidatus Sumerlaeia bacterium]
MGILNAWMLAGMAALAVPVLIHLLRSRRYKEAKIGSLRFLRQAIKENVRWRRLRDLLLLFARLLAVALLVFLFARPFLREPDRQTAGAVDAVVLVDASGSMNGEGAFGVSAYEMAREAARKTIDDIRKSTKDADSDPRVTVALFADTVREIVVPEDSATQNIAEIEIPEDIPAGGKTDYAMALGWARKRLALSDSDTKRIYLHTDLQRAGLPAMPMADWPIDIPVIIRPTKQAVWNAAISDVRHLSPWLGDKGEVEVAYSFFGKVPEGEKTLELAIEGQKPLRQKVEPLSGRATFEFVQDDAGVYTGRARILSEDGIALDNERPLAFRVGRPARVLLVDGEPGETIGKTAFENETYYLEKALSVAKREDGQSAFSVERVESLPAELDNIEGIALCNVGALDDAAVESLKAFAEGGGGLVWFLGGKVESENYGAYVEAGIFPADFEVRRAAIPRYFMSWEGDHAALRLFEDREKGDLSRIIFRDAFAFEPDEEVEVLARLTSNSPAIITKEAGRGRLVAIANPADRAWSDWPSEKIFLPLVREIFSWVTSAHQGDEAIQVRYAGLKEKRAPGIYQDLGMHIESGNEQTQSARIEMVVPDPAESDIRT